MSFKVVLPNFEGPLDLLLYLIKKDKMNICDVSISHIAQQFIDYVNQGKDINVETMSEFLVMASTLLEIKSKMLLPNSAAKEDDTSEELVSKLIEYNNYKEFIEKFKAIYPYKPVFLRGNNSIFVDLISQPKELVIDKNKLIDVYKLMISKQREITLSANSDKLKEITRKELSIFSIIKSVIKDIIQNGVTSFKKLIKDASREEIVLKFIALLELVKVGKIKITQDKVFGNINIFKREKANG